MFERKAAGRGGKTGRRRGWCAVVAVAAFIGLAACADDEELYTERPVADLYNDAFEDMLDGDYVSAASGFDEVERQHPYSVWATKAQLMAAFSYYQNNNYDQAVLAAERFIALHPGNPDTAYAHYLIGLSYYERISDVGRDQRMTERALDALLEVTRRYPDSQYARDAALKISLARDHLAGKEMEVGRTYQDLEIYVAAINRFRTVVVDYQTTSHVPEALHRLTESYLALGVIGEAQAAAAVLGHNYPGSRWYRDSYALLVERELEPRLSEGSWFSRIF